MLSRLQPRTPDLQLRAGQAHPTTNWAGARRTLHEKGSAMKKIILIATLTAASFAGASTAPAIAGDVTKATTKAACSQAGGVWNAQTGKCTKKKKSGKPY